jgi:DNA-binding transcriptional ArsR family regulator
MTALDRTLAALAEPTRRRVIDLLHKRPHRAGELAQAARVSAPLMSRHLRVLRVSGLIEETHDDPRDTRVRIYRLRRAPFTSLRGWLDEVEMFWTDQLGAFRDHVERTKPGRRA